jgi:DNA-binding MarR family transcriptional regulator
MSASPQELAALLGRLLADLMRASSPELFRLLGELGLSFTQVKALHILREAGEVSVKDVGERLGLSFPAASRALDGLAQRGFVERRESAQDRRSRLVSLLPAGDEVLDTIARGRLSALEDFTARLSPQERAGLHAALLPIVERIPTP